MCANILFELPKGATDFKHKKLDNKTITMVGYGNQGRSQAQNLRDSGFNVIVGNIDDDYRPIAKGDGFKVLDISMAVQQGDIIFILVPDEVQEEVFEKQIAPYLKTGGTIVFASGFNFYSRLIQPAPTINVLLLAPKMIGIAMRERYLRGQGFPALTAVGQAYGNHEESLMTLMLLADGIGVFLPSGCMIESSFREETLLNLLGEQAGRVPYFSLTGHTMTWQQSRDARRKPL